MKECYNCLVYYLKMMLWNLLQELFENKSCTVLFNLKVLGLHAFFKMDEENLKKGN